MATDQLLRPRTSQTDAFDIDDDILAYEIADVHDVANRNVGEEVEPLAIQTVSSAQRKYTNSRLLAEMADSADNQYFYEKFGILSKRANLDWATQNVVPLSLEERVLNYKHYSTMSNYSGVRWM